MSNEGNLTRLRKAQVLMKERGIDGLMLFRPENVHALTNAVPDGAFLTSLRELLCTSCFVPQEGEAEVVVLWLDRQASAEQSWVKNVRPYSAPPTGDVGVKLVKVVKNRGYGKATLGVEKNWITASQFDGLKQALPEATLVDVSDIVPMLAACKSPTEIEYLEKAINFAHIGMKAAISAIKEGVSEIDLAAEAEYAMRKAGSRHTSQITTVGAGIERSLLAHPWASENNIKKGDIIIIDLGAVYEGFRSDLARTIVYGTPTTEQKEIFKAVFEAQTAAFEAAKPGGTTGEIAAAVKSVFDRYELEKYCPEFRGHGIGMHLQAWPFIFTNAPFPVAENDTLSLLETAVFKPGVGQIRIEDIALITSEGYRILGDRSVSVPRELIVL